MNDIYSEYNASLSREAHKAEVATLKAQLETARNQISAAELDAVKALSQVDELNLKLEMARKAIENAPHSPSCEWEDFEPCNCWKSEALAQIGAGQKCERCTPTNWCGSCDFSKFRARQKADK
jgi:hypothetical protein